MHLKVVLSTLALSALPLLVPAQETRPTTRPAAATDASGPATRPTSAALMEKKYSGDEARELARKIAETHERERWFAQNAFAADTTVVFGGEERFKGRMIFRPDMSVVRMESDDGKVMVFDGEKAWVAPPEAKTGGERFTLLTWPYFLSAPMKLEDPGTNIEYIGTKEMEAGTMEALKLTFEPGVGDAPDDWYIVYSDPETGRVAAMAYIVTYGKSKEKIAESEPHAIVYGAYETVDGIPISTEWWFRHWSHEEGVHGDPLGHVFLSNMEFTRVSEEAFEKPENAVEAPLPGQ